MAALMSVTDCFQYVTP